MTLCPGANGWRSAVDGQGITATLYEYGPATVTITVIAVSGKDTIAAVVSPGQSTVTFNFPSIAASDVRDVTVQAIGSGPLPAQCILGRSDR